MFLKKSGGVREIHLDSDWNHLLPHWDCGLGSSGDSRDSIFTSRSLDPCRLLGMGAMAQYKNQKDVLVDSVV